MNCARIRMMMSAHVDGELHAPARQAVQAHVATCPDCCSELASIEAVVRAAARVSQVDPPSELRRRIAAATTASNTTSAPETNWLARLVTARVTRLAVGAAAAGMLAFALLISMRSEPPRPSVRRVENAASVGKPKVAITAASPQAAVQKSVEVKQPRRIRDIAVEPKRIYRLATARPVPPAIASSHAPAYRLPTVPELTVSCETETVKPESPEDVAADLETVAPNPPPPKEHRKPQGPELVVTASLAAPAVSPDNAEWIRQVKLQERLSQHNSEKIGADASNSRL